MPPTTSSPIPTGAGGGYLRGLVMPSRSSARSWYLSCRSAGVARRLAVGEFDRGGRCAADDAGDSHAAGIQRVSHDPAHDHVDEAGIERRDDALVLTRRCGRPGRGRWGDSRWLVRCRRSGNRRCNFVLDFGRDPVRRDYQGGDPHQRSGSAVHVGWASGTPDGDRRRLARRADRSARRPRRRDEVYRQADCFGAMDGASRFVRGDAVAGVIILLVNIGGGLFLGMVNHGMRPSEAVNVFTKLTIGDGLVSQVPAFLISLAAALIVTRSSSSTDLNRDVVTQLFSQPGVLATAAVFLGLMALTPLPRPLLTLAGSLSTPHLSWSRRDPRSHPKRPVTIEAFARLPPVLPPGSTKVPWPVRRLERKPRQRPWPRLRPSQARNGSRTCCTSTRSSWRSASG